MATVARPNGATPVDSLTSNGQFTGKTRRIPIATTYGTAIFDGDFVKKVSGGTVEKDTITTALATGHIGVFLGCEYTDPTTGQLTHSSQWPASNAATDAVAYVADDPFLIFRMQASAAVAASSLGLNIKGINTAGDTNIGRSKNALDGASEATTNTFPFRIIGFVEDGASTAGDAFTDIFVTYAQGTATLHHHMDPLGL